MRKATVSTVFALLMAIGSSAQASSLSLNLNLQAPNGPGNQSDRWIQAIFEDVGTDTVSLTMSTSGLVEGDLVNDWFFNVDPTLDGRALSFTQTGGVTGSVEELVSASDTPRSNRTVKFGFASSGNNTFGVLQTVVFVISGAGVNINSFNFASLIGGGVFLSAAQIKLLTGDLGWMTAPKVSLTPVPEETSVLLLGLVFAALIMRARTQRTQTALLS